MNKLATVRRTTSYVLQLELSPEEAARLRGMLQNPLTEDEDLVDSQVRHAIFHALKEVMDCA